MIQRCRETLEPFRQGCSPASNEMTSGNDHPAEVVEISLLLPSWQVSAIETAAHDAGLTAGEMVRHLLRDFIAGLPGKAHRRSEIPTAF
jgi:hypothetical protein